MFKDLSASDVDDLLADRTVASRATTAAKVARQFAGGTLTARERQIAEEILRTMVRDTESRVRQELASVLKDCPELPHDVAQILAADIDSIALPIIRHSAALTEEDLIEIVAQQRVDRQKAVATRAKVSAQVSDALVDLGHEDVVASLAANPGADISEASMEKALDRFGTRSNVTDPLVMRAALPVRIAERLVHLVSDTMQEHLLTHHEISNDLAFDVVLRARERATLNLVSLDGGRDEVSELVAALRDNKRLSPSIIIRALYTGDVRFVEAALARLADISVENAATLMRDGGSLGLKALLERAGLNVALYRALRAGIEVCEETDYDGGENDRERYRRRVIERLLTRFEGSDAEATIGSDNIEYLVRKLSPAA